MEATIRINTDELDSGFVENIKKMFPHHDLQITVQPMDETDFIMSKPAYAAELLERMKRVDAGEPLITISQTTSYESRFLRAKSF